MYKNEKMEILELLSKGLINAKTAETLLKALDKEYEVLVPNKETAHTTNTAFKMLAIEVVSANADVVNIKIPLEFAKLLKTKSFANGFNTSEIDIDEIINIASSGIMGEIINVKTSNGDKVKITIE